MYEEADGAGNREVTMKKEEWMKMREENVPCGVSQQLPAMIAEAEGVVVRDVEGKEFLDFSGGIGLLNVGHCTGRMFAFEHSGVEPDLLITAKSLAAGMPLGAVTGRAEIMDAVESGGLGGTFGGNPVSCRAALEVIKLLRGKKLVERANGIGGKIMDRFRSFEKKFPFVGDVRGLGAMNGMEIVVSKKTPHPNANLTKGIVKRCYEKGLIMLTAGEFGNVIRHLVPLVATDAQLERGLQILEEAMAEQAN
jgi:4-aminobutyrate aminotransferase/(S)-3-amino-2-methylpropionate transaminase